MRCLSQILAVALAAFPLAVSAQTPTGQPLLTVGGEGLVSRSPDRARVALDIVTNDDAATRSGGKNTTTYNAFVARVAALGVPAGDVRTTSYNVTFVPYPPKDLPADQRQPRYGYITTRSLSVLVSPIDSVGKIVDAATASGVTQIGGVSFELKDRGGAYLAALAAAMNDAKTAANAVAVAGGFHIVRIHSVWSGYEPAPVPIAPMMRRMSAAAALEPPTELGPSGPIDVNAHVTITYDIRP